MQLNERNLKIEGVKTYLEDVDLRIKNILRNLNWNMEDTIKEFNSNSGSKTENDNTKNCKEDLMFPETFKQLHTITLDQSDLSKIFEDNDQNTKAPGSLPNKFSDVQTKFNRKQKLRIYDYVIAKTGKFSEPEMFSLQNEEKILNSKEEQRSFANIVALRRNMKRRRLKYRIGKDPPISTTEEFRDLIEIQMTALVEYNNQKDLDKKLKIKSKKCPLVDRKKNYKIYENERKRSKSQGDKIHKRRGHLKNTETTENASEHNNVTLKSKTEDLTKDSSSFDFGKNLYENKHKKKSRERYRSNEKKESKSSKNGTKSKKSKKKYKRDDNSPKVNCKYKKRKDKKRKE